MNYFREKAKLSTKCLCFVGFSFFASCNNEKANQSVPSETEIGKNGSEGGLNNIEQKNRKREENPDVKASFSGEPRTSAREKIEEEDAAGAIEIEEEEEEEENPAPFSKGETASVGEAAYLGRLEFQNKKGEDNGKAEEQQKRKEDDAPALSAGDKRVNKILDDIDSGQMTVDDLIAKGKEDANGDETLLKGWEFAEEAVYNQYSVEKKEHETIGLSRNRWDVTPGNQCLTRKSILKFNEYFSSVEDVEVDKKCNIFAIVKIMRDKTGLLSFDELKLNKQKFTNKNQKKLYEFYTDISQWEYKMLQLKNKEEVLKNFNKVFSKIFAYDYSSGYSSWVFDYERANWFATNFEKFKNYINNDEIIEFSSLRFKGEIFRNLLKTNSIDIEDLYKKVKDKFMIDGTSLDFIKNSKSNEMLSSIIDEGGVDKKEMLDLAKLVLVLEKKENVQGWRAARFFSSVLYSIVNQNIFQPKELIEEFNKLRGNMRSELAGAFLKQKDENGFYAFSDIEIMKFLTDQNHNLISAASEEIRRNRTWLIDLLPDGDHRGHVVNYANADETIGAVDYIGGIGAIESIYRDKIKDLEQNNCKNIIFKKLNEILDLGKRDKIKVQLKREEIDDHYRYIVAVLGESTDKSTDDNWQWFFEKMYDCSIANGINTNSCKPLGFMIDGLSHAMHSLKFYLEKAYDSAALEQVKDSKHNTKEDEEKLKKSIRINKIITNMFFNKQKMVDLAMEHKHTGEMAEKLIQIFKIESKVDPDENQLERIKAISLFYIDFIKDEKNLSTLSKQAQEYKRLKKAIWENMGVLSCAMSINDQSKQAFESMENIIKEYVENEITEGRFIIPKGLAKHNSIEVIPNYIRQIFINMGIPEAECSNEDVNYAHKVKVSEKTKLSDAIEGLARKIDKKEENEHYENILREAKKKTDQKEQLGIIAECLNLTGYDDRLEEFAKLKDNEAPNIDIKYEDVRKRVVFELIQTFREIARKL